MNTITTVILVVAIIVALLYALLDITKRTQIYLINKFNEQQKEIAETRTGLYQIRETAQMHLDLINRFPDLLGNLKSDSEERLASIDSLIEELNIQQRKLNELQYKLNRYIL